MTERPTPKFLSDVEQRLRMLMVRVQSEERIDQAAHDIRNALSVIVMYRELVTDETCDQTELLADIESALAYADELLVRFQVPFASQSFAS